MYYPQIALWQAIAGSPGAMAIINNSGQGEIWIIGDNTSQQFSRHLPQQVAQPHLIRIAGCKAVIAIYAGQQANRKSFFVLGLDAVGTSQLWVCGDLTAYQLQNATETGLLAQVTMFTTLNLQDIPPVSLALYEDRLLLLVQAGSSSETMVLANAPAVTAYQLGEIREPGFFMVKTPQPEGKSAGSICCLIHLTADFLYIATQQNTLYAKATSSITIIPSWSTHFGIMPTRTQDGWFELYKRRAGKIFRIIANEVSLWLQLQDHTVVSIFSEALLRIDEQRLRGDGAHSLTNPASINLLPVAMHHASVVWITNQLHICAQGRLGEYLPGGTVEAAARSRRSTPISPKDANARPIARDVTTLIRILPHNFLVDMAANENYIVILARNNESLESVIYINGNFSDQILAREGLTPAAANKQFHELKLAPAASVLLFEHTALPCVPGISVRFADRVFGSSEA